MHILFLTDNFPPEVNAPASRTFEHCREWVKQGHKVTVITGLPNFPRGEIYPGYRNKLYQCETMAGIKVVRVWTYIAANEGVARRTLDYLSYMLTSFIAGLFIRKVDVIVGTSPQFFTACAARALSFFKRKPWVFELRDLWPESIEAVGAMKNARLLKLLERVELSLYRSASEIISVTRSFKENLIARGIHADKITVVTNGVDLTRYHPVTKSSAVVDKLGLAGKFVVGYIGTHGMAHGLQTILQAAEQLKAEPRAQHIVFLLLGDGACKQALVAQAAKKRLDNVLFVDSVSKEEVPAYWSVLDATVIHLIDSPAFAKVIPSKLFEAMAMGVPVVHAVRGESADITNDFQLGPVIEPEKPEQLVRAVLSLLTASPEQVEAYRRNCIEAAKAFDRTILAMKLLERLQRTVATGTVTGFVSPQEETE